MSTHIVNTTLYPIYNTQNKSKSGPSGWRYRFTNPSPFGLPAYVKDKKQSIQYVGVHRRSGEVFLTLLKPTKLSSLSAFEKAYSSSRSTSTHPQIGDIEWVGAVRSRTTKKDIEVYVPRKYWAAPPSMTGANVDVDSVLFSTRIKYRRLVIARMTGIYTTYKQFIPKEMR